MKNFKYTPKQQATLLCLISIAKDSHVDYETSPNRYTGGAFFTFETDRFGGCFLGLHIDKDGAITNTSTQKQMTLGDVKNAVPKLRDELLKHRDLAALADFINSQNED